MNALYHFSEDPAITRFVPRPVQVPAARPRGQAWLNGPLVWAIDDAHQPLYLFPRDCPRILVWADRHVTMADRVRWMGAGPWRMAAYVEAAWRDRMRTTRVFRYVLPATPFEALDDAGMHVARAPVEPLAVDTLGNLEVELSRSEVRLTYLPTLAGLRPAWDSTMKVSGIRLRNAVGW